MRSNDDNWLTLQQAAAYLQLSVTTLRRRCQHRQIRHATDIYGHIRFRREWLDNTMIENDVTAYKTISLTAHKRQKTKTADALRLIKKSK